VASGPKPTSERFCSDFVRELGPHFPTLMNFDKYLSIYLIDRFQNSINCIDAIRDLPYILNLESLGALDREILCFEGDAS
jgi:hypothetical protein